MGLMKFDFEMTPTSGIAPAEAASRTDTHLVGMNGPLKRAFDIILTAPIILFLLPALLMIAVAVKRGGGPVLYRQKRIGKDGKAFQMLKFRSMHVDADERLAQLIETCPDSAEEWACYQKLRNDPRVTRFGHLLRRSSLDELPQLFNILRGDMSLVGQRPIMPFQRDEYGLHIRGYERARPGLTGLWQVSGRNALTFKERAAMGSDYINRWSLLLDLKILFLTIPAVLLSRDAF